MCTKVQIHAVRPIRSAERLKSKAKPLCFPPRLGANTLLDISAGGGRLEILDFGFGDGMGMRSSAELAMGVKNPKIAFGQIVDLSNSIVGDQRSCAWIFETCILMFTIHCVSSAHQAGSAGEA